MYPYQRPSVPARSARRVRGVPARTRRHGHCAGRGPAFRGLGPVLAFPMIMAVVLIGLTVSVGAQYRQRHRAHQAAWGLALALGAVGTLAYLGCVLSGDNAVLFRLYYIGGALLTAPLLGLGSVYLLPNPLWPRLYLALTVVGAALGITGILGQALSPAGLAAIGDGPGTTLIHASLALVPLIILNSLGTVGVVGVGLWSLYRSAVRHGPWVFVGGNGLIVAGTLLVAAAGGMARLDHGAGFWGAMTIGWIVLYAGFALMASYQPAARSVPASSSVEGAPSV